MPESYDAYDEDAPAWTDSAQDSDADGGMDKALLAEVINGRIAAIAQLITAMKDVRGQEQRVHALCALAIEYAGDLADSPPSRD